MVSSPATEPELVRKLVRRTAVFLAVLGAILFLSAGTLAWPEAWVYLAAVAVPGLAAGILLARHDPALLAERMGSLIQRGQKGWDKILMSAFFLLYIGWLVLMAFDAERFHWSAMPLAAKILGTFLIVLTSYLMWIVTRENSFAAPVVRVQRERGHAVVTTGPYAYVRHPMYAGAIPMLIGTPLLLGSWWGLAVSALLVVLLAIRATLEERTLTAELEGYAEYARRVSYRFVPGLW
jgi:protein-S-isoprenylcysteine O-methyltransferase Ste14